MWSAAAVLVCALDLMGRSARSLPPIELLASAPPEATLHVEGFVRPESNTIYLITSSDVFRTAQRSPHRCGARQALKKLASIIVHEEWHVRHGADEEGAYAAQLTELARLGVTPGSALYHSVTRAMLLVRANRERSGERLARR
jgi:hypothetical protein